MPVAMPPKTTTTWVEMCSRQTSWIMDMPSIDENDEFPNLILGGTHLCEIDGKLNKDEEFAELQFAPALVAPVTVILPRAMRCPSGRMGMPGLCERLGLYRRTR